MFERTARREDGVTGNDSCELASQRKRMGVLRLVLALCLEDLSEDMSGVYDALEGRRTSKKLRPTAWTSIKTPLFVGFGSGAFRVKLILDGCSFFDTTKAFMVDGELRTALRPPSDLIEIRVMLVY